MTSADPMVLQRRRADENSMEFLPPLGFEDHVCLTAAPNTASLSSSKDFVRVPRTVAWTAAETSATSIQDYGAPLRPTVRRCGSRRKTGEAVETATSKRGPSGYDGSNMASNIASNIAYTFSFRCGYAQAFDFSSRPSATLQRGVKRRRHGQDVDGPNTAGLACKKRRIRIDLITSRLSQPYSQPATHILNREGMDSGDKRFLKMATAIDSARRIAHLHATSILRFSVMNRLRKRLGLGRPGIAGGSSTTSSSARASPTHTAEVNAFSTTAKPMWQPQSIQMTSSAKYLRPSGSGPGSPAAIAATAGYTEKSPLSKAMVPKTPPAIQMSNPAALPLPSSDLAAAHSRPTTRMHPVHSPELRAHHDDEFEEDSFAFLHGGIWDYGNDEGEDDDGKSGSGGAGDVTDDTESVYSDFSLIFGGGGAGTGAVTSPESLPHEDHSYEEYLDELDGISWVTR